MLRRAVPVLLLALPLLAACSGSDDSSARDTANPDVPTVTCDYPSDGTSPAKEASTPPTKAPESGTATATLATSQGDIGVELDRDNAPCTVNSFLSLAEQGYFDGTDCHRLTTAGIFVLQCGDPSGTGSGGPGYSFADELSGQETYGAGTLAMANAGPDTNGSQFFIVYDDSQLDPNYTVFGKIDDAGLAVVRKVAKAGTDNANGQGDGHPDKTVTIESISTS
ncbi:MAG: peptidylprolyl isomerase [Nocardioides sp.]|uniref:peptidylprolyl isomerase n=1 Tax=Nocardioides sp. TaxID=35761 RepID=UPI0039E28236